MVTMTSPAELQAIRRDRVAELLSLVRYAYASGFREGNSRAPIYDTELLYAASEHDAIAYVQAREENERHPLAILCAALGSQP